MSVKFSMKKVSNNMNTNIFSTPSYYIRLQLIRSKPFSNENNPTFTYRYQISIEQENHDIIKTFDFSTKTNYYKISWPDIFTFHPLSLKFTIIINVYQCFNNTNSNYSKLTFKINVEHFMLDKGKRKNIVRQAVLSDPQEDLNSYLLRMDINNNQYNIDFNRISSQKEYKLYFTEENGKKLKEPPVKKSILGTDEKYYPWLFLYIPQDRENYYFPLASFEKHYDTSYYQASLFEDDTQGTDNSKLCVLLFAGPSEFTTTLYAYSNPFDSSIERKNGLQIDKFSVDIESSDSSNPFLFNFDKINSKFFNQNISFSFLVLKDKDKFSNKVEDIKNETIRNAFNNIQEVNKLIRDPSFSKIPSDIKTIKSLSTCINYIATNVVENAPSLEDICDWIKSKTKPCFVYNIFFLIIENPNLKFDSNSIYNTIFDIANLPFSLIIIPLVDPQQYNKLDVSNITTTASTTISNTCVTVAECPNELEGYGQVQKFFNKITDKVEQNLQKYISFYLELKNERASTK